MKMESKDESFKLLSGHYMPLVGFGTFQIRGNLLIEDVLDWAFAAGYRSIDTAAVYGNEHHIGVALKKLLPKYNLKREDIFITSKLSPADHGDEAYEAVKSSLKNLDCDYLDLYLIHWPGVTGIPTESVENSKLRAASWHSLVKAKNDGLIKDIGVSNYMIRHLTELLANCHNVKPSVNQIEWHPNCHDSRLRKLCQKEGILLQAYSSLGGSGNTRLLSDPLIVSIAKRIEKTTAQVLLRWALQQSIGIIPKACCKERIEENIDLNFILSDKDMLALNNRKPKRYAWDPNAVV